jgi:hypothetical protein
MHILYGLLARSRSSTTIGRVKGTSGNKALG